MAVLMIGRMEYKCCKDRYGQLSAMINDMNDLTCLLFVWSWSMVEAYSRLSLSDWPG